MRKILSLAVLSALFSVSTARDVNAWKQRSVYQVVTDRFFKSSGDKSNCNLGSQPYYCGGDFDGIVQQLDYIKNLGFDAIWISPVIDNTENGFHGYWARDWKKINDKFGGPDALKRLVKAAHDKDIWVMVDVVANHVGPVGMDFSQINPFNQGQHYHDRCQISDWGNQWQVENCRLSDLPDLKQEDGWVRQQLKDWISSLVKDYDLDGIRIDTIPEVPKDFWKEFGQASGVFQMGECFNGFSGYVGDYQNHIDALFNYPMYYSIRDAFAYGKSMKVISERWSEEAKYFKDIDALGIFVDNHDNARFLNSQGDHRLFKSALAFSLTARGIPFFYYGSEQGFAGGNDPYNREAIWNNLDQNSEIYKFVSTLMKARKTAGASNSYFNEKYVDDQFYAYSRGQFFVALTNQLNGEVHREVPNTGFHEGQTVCNIFFAGDCVTVKNGNLPVYLNNGEAKIFLPKTSSFFQQHQAESFLE